MKTSTLIIITLVSFTVAQAQETTFLTKKAVDIKKTQNSKVDFYKELIATNDLQITIADNSTTAFTRTKAAFYNELIAKNNLKSTTALAHNDIKINTNTYTVNTEAAISLVP